MILMTVMMPQDCSSDPASSLDEFSAHCSRSSSSACSPVYTSGAADHANNDHADHPDYDDYDQADHDHTDHADYDNHDHADRDHADDQYH